MQFHRTKILLGENFKKLQDSNVIVFGLGGVGGYVAEMLVRSGIGAITIVDFDDISITNLNRQIIALHSTMQTPKTEAFRQRLLDINPNLSLKVINDKYTAETREKFKLSNYDFVVDAIDSFDNKVDLITTCYNQNLNIISSMGTGNKIGIPSFEICDIYDTYNDALAKKLRGVLRKNGVKNLKVVFCKEKCTINFNFSSDKINNMCDNKREIGSIVYYPAMCACMITAYVVQNIIEGDKNE